jgi:hypothetical protein
LSKHPTKPLASAQVNHDQLAVELVEPDGMPAMVRILWPAAPTVVDPRRYADTASAVMRLLAKANVELVRLRAARRL